MANKFQVGDQVRKIDGSKTNGTITDICCMFCLKSQGSTCQPPCQDPLHTKDYYRVSWQGKSSILNETELELENLTSTLLSAVDEFISDKDLELPQSKKQVAEKDCDENKQPTLKEIRFDKNWFDRYNNSLPGHKGPLVDGWETPSNNKTL